MCGFVGIAYRKYDNVSEAKSSLTSALESISYRGPNDEGFFEDGQVLAGFKRLSILDLSSRGHQPMKLEDEELAILHNGEVYNYRDLRKTLKKKGYKFRSETDTEVVLRSFQEWGVQSFSRFNGMFATVIVDLNKDQVHLARDHPGIKPLYYFKTDKQFGFASELKALREFISFRENREVMREYLVYRSLLGNDTPLEDVKRVMPGNCLSLDLSNWSLHSSRIQYRTNGSRPGSFQENKTRVKDILQDSVRKRLISDVEVGLQLSGGVDSSLIAAIIQTHFPRSELHSFSISFAETKYDESRFQREVYERYGINHHDILFEAQDFVSNLRKAVRHNDFPIIQPNAVAIMKLASVASEYVTVLLSGEGADETFMGYPKYELLKRRRLLDFLGRLKPISTSLLPNLGKFGTAKNLIEQGDTFEEIFSSTRRNEYILQVLSGSGDLGYEKRLRFLQSRAPETSVPIFDQKTSLPVLLRRFDRMLMASSMEGRVPFCDSRLMDLVNQLPIDHKIGSGILKRILKKIGEDYVSKDLLYREKMGFSLPLQKWFNEHEDFKEYVHIISSPAFENVDLINQKRVDELIDKERYSKKEVENVLWPLLSYRMWREEFLQ